MNCIFLSLVHSLSLACSLAHSHHGDLLTRDLLCLFREEEEGMEGEEEERRKAEEEEFRDKGEDGVGLGGGGAGLRAPCSANPGQF